MTFKYLASPILIPSRPAANSAIARPARPRPGCCGIASGPTAQSSIVTTSQRMDGYAQRTSSSGGDYNRAMIDRADELLVLTIEGWKESTGVNAEITYAAELGCQSAS